MHKTIWGGLLALTLCATATANPEAQALQDAWTARELSPQAALAELQARYPDLEGPRYGHTAELTDPHGRTTTLTVSIPAQPRADGRYSVLVALHGIRGWGERFAGLARKLAPPGTIVLAPSAQFLPADLEAQDDFPFPDEAARRDRLPHWWSARADSFPLLALDYVRRRYPIDPDRVLLLGYSMGGFGTWNLGLRHPDHFAALAPLACGISRLEFFGEDLTTRALLHNARHLPSFSVHGSDDNVIPVGMARRTAAELEALDAPHTFHEIPDGPHVLREFIQGDAYADALRTWLGHQTRDPHPSTISHTTLDPQHGAAYWLEINALADPAQPARVDAQIDGQRIVARTENLASLTLYLDTAHIDTTQPVTIEVDGTVLFTGLVQPSLESVARSFARSKAPTLTYTHRVDLDLR